MATLKEDIYGSFRKLYGKAGDPVTIIKDYGNTLSVEDSAGNKWFVAADLVNIGDVATKPKKKEEEANQQTETKPPAKRSARTQKPVKIDPSQSSLF